MEELTSRYQSHHLQLCLISSFLICLLSRLSVPGFTYSLVVGEPAATLPSTDRRTDLLILECTRVNREKIMKHDSRQITTLSHHNPQIFSVIPPVIPSTSCCAVYRRFGVSTHQLVLAPPSSVDKLPYAILLVQRTRRKTASKLELSSNLLRHCAIACVICPPYFTVVLGEVSGMTLQPYSTQLMAMDGRLRLRWWTSSIWLLSSRALLLLISRRFRRIKEVVFLDGERVDTAQWQKGLSALPHIAFRSFVPSRSIRVRIVCSFGPHEAIQGTVPEGSVSCYDSVLVYEVYIFRAMHRFKIVTAVSYKNLAVSSLLYSLHGPVENLQQIALMFWDCTCFNFLVICTGIKRNSQLQVQRDRKFSIYIFLTKQNNQSVHLEGRLSIPILQAQFKPSLSVGKVSNWVQCECHLSAMERSSRQK